MNAAEWILRAGARRPEAIAIRHRATTETRDVTYGALCDRVRRTAGALRAAGARQDDRVLVALPDLPALIEVFLGAIWAGAIPILVNPALRDDDYRAFADDFEPRLAVTTAAIAPTLPVLALTVGGTLDDAVERGTPLVEPAATRDNEPAFWLLSSGTTGRPKGVIHLHRSIPHVCATYGRDVLGIREDDVCHATSKSFFAYGLGASVYLPLAAGATTVLSPEPFAPARTWAILAGERPSLFFAVPSVYRALLAAAPDDARAALSSVRIAVSAGEALPEALFDEWRGRFGVEILDGIGSTELLHIYVSNRPGDAGAGTVGRPVPGYDVRVVGEDGRPVADGEVGMMLVRGASAAAGYWRRPDATEHAFRDGWYVSGDRAIRGDDGGFRILGRADDLFKVSGQWVLPADVEAVVAAVSGVCDVAVVASETGAGLLEVVACVVLDGTASAAEVDARVRNTAAERLPRYKRPARLVVLDALPRTATGKLQRKVLRDALAR